MPYYANSGQVIATSAEGISIADVASALASTYLDVASLCTYSGINKWSKVKPVRGTSPAETDFAPATPNHTNQTGIYAGCRGEATGFPVYWGMKYPMNSANQNSSKAAKSNLLELCYDIVNGKGNHPNYEYVTPVIGTDFCRLTDFNGYYNHSEAFLDAGVSGAKAGTPATLKMHIFENNGGLTIYAMIPSGSIGWNFKDLVPEPASYYLVAEFYKNDTVNVWKSGSTANPVKTVWSSVSFSTVTGMTMLLTVPIADIKTALGITTTSDYSFYVCVGFNKKSTSSAAFVAPWKSGEPRCATLVTVQQLSPYVVSISKYAPGNIGSPSASQYVAFPTSLTTITYDWVWFQTTVTNNSTSDMVIWLGGTSTPSSSNRLAFRVFAIGNFPTMADGSNYGYVQGGQGSQGLPINLRPSLSTNVPDTVNNITIPAGQSKTVYFKPVAGFIPHGTTNQIMFEVSSDGTTWVNTGDVTFAGFKRN